jgi:phycocyanobilin:ferredoxin oxidoreductase
MIVSDVADIIRSAVKTLPITKMECDFPEIHKDDVTIVNEMWHCPGLRKLHLETGRTKNLEVLHCVLYPDPAYPIPIFGCDIVANDKVVTAAIVDVSPVRHLNQIDIYPAVTKISNRFQFKERRALPLWSDDIFSPHCKFMRLRTYNERIDYCELLSQLLTVYCGLVEQAELDTDWVNTMLRLDDQIYYCKQQKKNQKTIAVLSRWFDPLWARNYIDTILFDEPRM